MMINYFPAQFQAIEISLSSVWQRVHTFVVFRTFPAGEVIWNRVPNSGAGGWAPHRPTASPWNMMNAGRGQPEMDPPIGACVTRGGGDRASHAAWIGTQLHSNFHMYLHVFWRGFKSWRTTYIPTHPNPFLWDEWEHINLKVPQTPDLPFLYISDVRQRFSLRASEHKVTGGTNTVLTLITAEQLMRYLGRKRIMMSPSPVAEAPPAELSA